MSNSNIKTTSNNITLDTIYNNEIISILCFVISIYFYMLPQKKWIQTSGKIINIIKDNQGLFITFVVLHSKGKVKIKNVSRMSRKLQDNVYIEYDANKISSARFTSIFNLDNIYIALIFFCFGMASNKHLAKIIKPKLATLN